MIEPGIHSDSLVHSSRTMESTVSNSARAFMFAVTFEREHSAILIMIRARHSDCPAGGVARTGGLDA
jgi:hypothetical protein